MSEVKLKEPNWQLIWGQVHLENEARKESMAWAVDKLRKLKRNCEYCAASCEEIAQALSDSNPKLRGGAKP